MKNLDRIFLNGNNISEITDLDKLTNLQWLELNKTQINEIKGLSSLENLETLYLDTSKIKELKGLERLDKLKKLKLLFLGLNPINEEEKHFAKDVMGEESMKDLINSYREWLKTY